MIFNIALFVTITVIYFCLASDYRNHHSVPIEIDPTPEDTIAVDSEPVKSVSIAQVMPCERVSTVKLITPDMLLSKAGKPLVGAARTARIRKLEREGYELI